MVILNNQSVAIHHSSDELAASDTKRNLSKRCCEIPPYALGPGKYSVDVFLAQRNREMFQELRSVVVFEVVRRTFRSDHHCGAVRNCGPGLLTWH